MVEVTGDDRLDADGAGKQWWDGFLRGLPKAELHVHLVGTIEPRTAFRMARRNGVVLPWRTVEELSSSYGFTDLQAFLDVSDMVCASMLTPQDFFDVTDAYLARARQDGVVRSEMLLALQGRLARGVSLETMMTPVLEAVRSAHASHGVSAGLIVGIDRSGTEVGAFALLDRLTPWLDQVSGFGLVGPEVKHPPRKFASFFKHVRGEGFRTSAHAGEEGPASFVRDAVEALGVDRVDHGVACVQDAEVLELLRVRGTPVTVCPLSNVRLGVVSSAAQHPLRRMLEEGLNVSVHSDDPPFFGGYVTENLMAVVSGLGLGVDDVLTLVRNGHRSAWTTTQDKQRWLDLVDAYVDAHVGACGQ